MEIKVYSNVFRRAMKVMSLENFLTLESTPFYDGIFQAIKHAPTPEDKRTLKKFIPVAPLSESRDLAVIDIDGLEEFEEEYIESLAEKLCAYPQCVAVKRSVSGNIYAIFKLKRDLDFEEKVNNHPDLTDVDKKYTLETDYKLRYYNLYLHLTLDLDVEIDYLPDTSRLRYFSNGMLYKFISVDTASEWTGKMTHLPNKKNYVINTDDEGAIFLQKDKVNKKTHTAARQRLAGTRTSSYENPIVDTSDLNNTVIEVTNGSDNANPGSMSEGADLVTPQPVDASEPSTELTGEWQSLGNSSRPLNISPIQRVIRTYSDEDVTVND